MSAKTMARGVCSFTRTKRRRVLWCAWWKAEPCASPFRAPDAWGGGAKDEAEARALAEAAADMPLQEIEGRWAGAWVRIRAGLPPFVARAPRAATKTPHSVNPYDLLGVKPAATLAEVKAAFRSMALEHHPDHGGSAEAFIALKRAYDTIVKRRARRRK